MIINNEFIIPGLSMIITLVSGTLTWFINQHNQQINSLKKNIEELQTKVDNHELDIHESKVRRQTDIDIITTLTANIKDLSEKITELRIELQNKQTRL